MTDKERKQLEQFNEFILQRVRGKMQLTDLLNFLRFEAMAYASTEGPDSDKEDSSEI